MLERKPVRRDPRVLALVPGAATVRFGAVDAWDVRGVGELSCGSEQTFRLSLARTIVRTRPTVIVCAPPPRRSARVTKMLRILAAVAAHSGVPLVSLAGDVAKELLDTAPADGALAAEYPELRAVELAEAAPAVRLAVASLASLNLPHRTYAATSHRAEPAVAPGPAVVPRRARPAGVPSARRARRRAGGRRPARARPPRE